MKKIAIFFFRKIKNKNNITFLFFIIKTFGWKINMLLIPKHKNKRTGEKYGMPIDRLEDVYNSIYSCKARRLHVVQLGQPA